ncbi:Cytochrome P450 52A13 [Beauveria bassiana]|nr:Cytochrome P450 52A13 [Beauveria bassiana]
MLIEAVNTTTVALAIPVCLLLFVIVNWLTVAYKVAKSSGVRAPSIGDNPISVKYQNQNRLYDFFKSIFDAGTPECPNAVEALFFGRRIIFTQEPEHIKTVLTAKFADYGKGPKFHEVWAPFLGDSIFTTDGAQWHDSRTLIRPMFVKDRVRDMGIFERWSDKLISKLPASGETVDMCDLFYRMTLDLTTDFLLGSGVGSLDKPFRRFIPQQQYRDGIKTLEKFMTPYIQQTLSLTPEELEKLSKSDKQFTFLHNIALFSRDPKVIRDQIMAVLLAGRDTTAATLSWTIYELANYPAVWTKLRQTVLEKVGPDSNPTYEDIKGMTYLTHAINETLRLYPAVPYNIRSCLQDSTLTGAPGQPDIACFKGNHVIYSTYAMQRRRDLYPPVSETFADPDIYSPDRWDHWTPRPWQYVPFNGGPRICIGQNFAITEIGYVCKYLVWKRSRYLY